MKFFCSHRGTISVFMALILLPVIVFGGLVTDAVRVYHSKGLISEAGELAMNAGLSFYDVKLKDEYGLLAMGKQPGEMDLEQYFVNTIRASGLEGSENIRSFLDLKIDGSFWAGGVDGSQIYQTQALKQQILEYMKYRGPVCIGADLIDKFKQIKDNKKQVDAIEKQTKFVESVEDLQEACEKAKKSIDEYLYYAEDEPRITKENLNAAVDEAEQNLRKAVNYLFMLYVFENFEEKHTEDNFIESMKGFNEAVGNAPAPEKSNLEANFAAYVQGIFYWNNIPQSGLGRKIEDAKRNAGPDGANEIDAVYNTYKNLVGRLSLYIGSLREEAYAKINSAQYDIKRLWKFKVDHALEKAGDCVKKLDKVSEKLNEAQAAHGEWKNKIEALPGGDLKKNMTKEAKNYEDLLDKDALNSLKRKLEENQDFLVEMLIKLEDTKFCGYFLVGDINKNMVKNKVFEMSHTMTVSINNPDTMLLNIADRGRQFMAANFEKYKFTEDLHVIREDVFYKKLQELCTQKNENPEKEKEGKDTTNHLLGKLASALTDDGIFGLKDINWQEKELPSAVLAQAESDGVESLDTDNGNADSRRGRKKALKNARKSLETMGNWMDSMARILEGAIENIYITEYGIQMFSYYTVNKQMQPDGMVVPVTPVKSLSGDDLTNNKMYRSEVEYMLWGKKNVQQNVRNTKLLLYGIRMVFNMIYAFTDSDINLISTALAEAMSCGILFLVPVFKTIIQIGVALGETACDVTDLLAGRDVPVIKDKDTRQIDLLNGGQQRPSGAYSKSGILTLNYKEYLTIFLLIRTVGSFEKTTLARIADCIQLNTDLDIIHAYTMLSVSAKVQSRTTFMKKAASLPDSGIASVPDDWYSITYQSVLGY